MTKYENSKHCDIKGRGLEFARQLVGLVKTPLKIMPKLEDAIEILGHRV